MKRWEYFSLLCGDKKPVNQQITEIVKVKIKGQKNVDVESLAKHIRKWLEEEVG